MYTFIYYKTVNVDKLQDEILLHDGLSTKYNSITTKGDEIRISFKENLIAIEKQSLDDIISNHEINDPLQNIKFKIDRAMNFGRDLIVQFAAENVSMGITQANKVPEVSQYLKHVSTYLNTGSLYAAMSEIDTLLSESIPSELSPFVTEDRLRLYRNKIAEFLQK